MGRRRSLAAFGVVALGGGVCFFGGGGCERSGESLPPFGEVVFEIDTDAQVPNIVDRARIDLFRADGTWIESRDIARPDPRDWPLSFGAFSRDERTPTEVLVRIRAYREGFTREYKGERERTTSLSSFVEPRVATDVASLCADAPLLEVGKDVRARRGKDALIKTSCDASATTTTTTTGSVAARVSIKEAGDYRFGVIEAAPERGTLRIVPVAWSLALRKQCADETSEIACVANGGSSPTEKAVLDQRLEPGEYTLLTAGTARFQPADLTLRMARVENWTEANDVPPPATIPPRLLSLIDGGGANLTPANEPEPGTAIDRVVVARITPGVRSRVQVDLRGACFGMAADLAVKDGKATLAEARSCVSSEGELAPVPVVGERHDPVRITSAQGSFGAGEAPCEGTWPNAAGLACIPGGVFVFGGPEFRGLEESSSWPPRIARMPRFFIDTQEVSIARWRDAIARGFVTPDPASPLVNNGALGTEIGDDDGDKKAQKLCPWTFEAGDREALPVSCISWYAARAFCNFVGGELPTEAEWEYVAAAAARPAKVPYPWGESDHAVRCDQATFGRSSNSLLGGGGCFRPDLFTTSPAATPGNDDITAVTKVVGLAGNVNEWLLDSAQPFTSDCWQSAHVTSPRCWEEHALMRSIRGGSWLGIPDALRPTFRTRQDPGKEFDATTGVRCVYRSPPP